MATKYFYGLGRRKTASAQVRLFAGAGTSTINDQDIEKYITRSDLFEKALEPLRVLKKKKDFHFTVKVSGSGEAAQVDAISHGLARALVECDEAFKPTLKEEGLLTRDARKVERKKPGRHKARKSVQWSKR